jgi:hypothetical protein
MCESKRFWIEVWHLSGYLCGKHAGIEAGDAPDSGMTGKASLPEIFFAYAIGSQHTKACDYDSSFHVVYHVFLPGSLNTEKD